MKRCFIPSSQLISLDCWLQEGVEHVITKTASKAGIQRLRKHRELKGEPIESLKAIQKRHRATLKAKREQKHSIA